MFHLGLTIMPVNIAPVLMVNFCEKAFNLKVNIFVVLSKVSYAITREKERDVFRKECSLDLMMSTFHTNIR